MSHETCYEISKIFFSNSYLEGNICDHKSAHLLGIGEFTGRNCRSHVDSRYPSEGIPKLALVTVLIASIITKGRTGSFTLASFSRNRRHWYLYWWHGYFNRERGRNNFRFALDIVLYFLLDFHLSLLPHLFIPVIPVISIIPIIPIISIPMAMLSFPFSTAFILMLFMLMFFMILGSRSASLLLALFVSMLTFMLLLLFRSRSLG